MGRTVQELLATISASELAEWQAFDRIEPFGDARQDFNTGVICQQIHAVMGKRTKPADFMYLHEPAKPKEELTEEQLSRRIAAGFGVNLG